MGCNRLQLVRPDGPIRPLQTAFGAFLAAVKAWAMLAPSRYDARNEFTVGQSRKIVEALGQYNLRVSFI